MSRPTLFRNHHGIQFRQCQVCEGAGEFTVAHYTGDPQLEGTDRCHEGGGAGDFRVTPVDVLEQLRDARRSLKSLRDYPDLIRVARRRYELTRADAMKVADLPSLRLEGYHARLRRTDPVAAEVFAPVFRAMGFAA